MQIYLSGGMYSGWQDNVLKLDGVLYYDPRKDVKHNESAIGFVSEEIDAVRNSDLIFCYIEEENPSGIGAAFECAIAYENNIPIVTVWEKDFIDPFFATTSLYLFNDFDKGVSKLNKIIKSKSNNRE